MHRAYETQFTLEKVMSGGKLGGPKPQRVKSARPGYNNSSVQQRLMRGQGRPANNGPSTVNATRLDHNTRATDTSHGGNSSMFSKARVQSSKQNPNWQQSQKSGNLVQDSAITAPTSHENYQGKYLPNGQKASSGGQKVTSIDQISPELAAQIVKNYILPMFESDDKKFLKQKYNKM